MDIMKTDFFTQLTVFQDLFLPYLSDFFSTIEEQNATKGGIANDMLARLTEFTLGGGKRLRPALLYYACACFVEQVPEAVFDLGVSGELMQSFFLVHDDIMDEAVLRRGMPSVHCHYADKVGKGSVQAKRYGEAMGILVGNLAAHLGLKAVAMAGMEATKQQVLSALYSEVCMDVGYGQAYDMGTEPFTKLTEAAIYQLYHDKTARYTTELPLLMAGILTDQSELVLKSLRAIGITLGQLYQLQDDIIGVFGNSGQLGKSTDSDIQQGKKTLLIWYALQQANRAQQAYLLQYYGNVQLGCVEADKVRAIFTETGALAYAKSAANRLASLCLEKLDALTLRKEGKDFILGFIAHFLQ